jgi:hypothetical protein
VKAIVRYCEDCQHREFVKVSDLRCLKGHKPRFYLPRNGDPYDANWGWKRRCADFVVGNHVKVISFSIRVLAGERKGWNEIRRNNAPQL